jgi:RND superfamily putative drug exporter
VYPDSSPQESATNALLGRIRDTVGGSATFDHLDVSVGGSTASSVDQTDYVLTRLPYFIGGVILMSFLLLMTVFRSVLVALKAAIMNILSIAAAYGVVGEMVKGGTLGGIFGLHEPIPVPSFMPMMMFAILFGLSMDYEVFLLSRIREEYVKSGDNSEAVADGLAATARVITAAAAIMVSVFLSFVLGDEVLPKIIGVGLATAILVDATIVRMVLVPSTMELLGDANWWVPHWLDRILPHFHVEADLELDDELHQLLDEQEPAPAAR